MQISSRSRPGVFIIPISVSMRYYNNIYIKKMYISLKEYINEARCNALDLEFH